MMNITIAPPATSLTLVCLQQLLAEPVGDISAIMADCSITISDSVPFSFLPAIRAYPSIHPRPPDLVGSRRVALSAKGMRLTAGLH